MNPYKYRLILTVFFVNVLILFFPLDSLAEKSSKESFGKIVSIEGIVEILRAGSSEWTPARLNDTLRIGDSIQTGKNSRTAITLQNDPTNIRLDQGSRITLGKDEKESFWVKLYNGLAYLFSKSPSRYRVDTAYLNGSVEGTEFCVRAEKDHTLLFVIKGKVRAANDEGSIVLGSGQYATAQAGKAPEMKVMVRPRDAVQWALYYPAILDYQVNDFQDEEENRWQEMVQRSIRSYRTGDLSMAISSIDKAPEDIRDPRFFIYRAGLLLTVGRVDEAVPDINIALEIDPSNSHAFALQSIIAMVQNRKNESLEMSQKAVLLDPESPSARIALSYSKQACFDLEGALESLKEAVRLDPENALALARLAEMWQSLGYHDNALEAAKKAAALNPGLARTQAVLGFAYLTQVNTKDAKDAFEKAIALDSADPLPRLGLGLAKIREGDLEMGRKEIEIAAALDPNNSLIRSYLGKTYFEEKRGPLDEEQYTIAKELDPLDPTPYFYDAIRKQTMNRPVEALQDLQKSIELNDNRAVYRSSLLLDEDLAARSASLGRIYSALGFQQLALVEGWNSVSSDPTNFSAHRFLADSYAALPRHEIARVSELLQSQLLQPININPVQPSLAESGLLILEGTGPSSPSLNEFNPLFNRNRLALQASGIVGGDNTLGGEIVQSGVWNRTSYSVGAFHYETDGFRENNDQNRDIYNIFFQTSFSPKTSVQAEFRYEEIEKGDLPLRFDPDDILKDLRENAETYSIRFGGHHEFSPSSDVIGSFIYMDQEDTMHDIKPSLEIDYFTQLEGLNAELQHLFRSERVSIISGAGYFNQSEELLRTYIPSPFPSSPDEYDTDHINLYVYSLINYPKSVIWNVGASGDFYKGGYYDLDHDKFNPKFGFIWNPYPNIILRGAVFRTFKRTLLSNQTIEPTQVAGFNQFFDDVDATEVLRYGLALDQKFSKDIFGGIEYSQRDLDFPYEVLIILPPPAAPIVSIENIEWKERLGRAYLYWAPHKWFSASMEFQYERLDRGEESTAGIKYVKTYRLPVGIRFYHPSGFTFILKTTYIDQRGSFLPQDSELFDPFIPGNDEFCVVEGSVNYRLPRRLGVISLEAKNLFDKSFKYYDTDPLSPSMQPQSLLLMRFTVAF